MILEKTIMQWSIKKEGLLSNNKQLIIAYYKAIENTQSNLEVEEYTHL